VSSGELQLHRRWTSSATAASHGTTWVSAPRKETKEKRDKEGAPHGLGMKEIRKKKKKRTDV